MVILQKAPHESIRAYIILLFSVYACIKSIHPSAVYTADVFGMYHTYMLQQSTTCFLGVFPASQVVILPRKTQPFPTSKKCCCCGTSPQVHDSTRCHDTDVVSCFSGTQRTNPVHSRTQHPALFIAAERAAPKGPKHK